MKLYQALFASCTAAAVIFTSACKSDDRPAGDPELYRVADYLRPPKIVKNIKSADMLYKVETDREDSGILVRIRYRAPNRYRFDFTMGNNHSICSVEGPYEDDEKCFKGWYYDFRDGLKVLTPEEVQLILKEAVRFPFNKYGLANFFENSDKIGSGILNHEECWLFTCQPQPFKTEEQLLIWVGQETKQIRLVEVGLEKVVQFFDYEDFGGLKLPRYIYESGKDGVAKTTLVSAVWNSKFPLTVFMPPVMEKKIQLADGRTFTDPVLIEKKDDSLIFAHKDGVEKLTLNDLSADTLKKISANDASAQKLLKELEVKEAKKAKEEAEREAKEAKKAKEEAEQKAKEAKEKKAEPVVVQTAPSEPNEWEKTQNALRDVIRKQHVEDLEKRLATQKKSGARFQSPAQYGFFIAGPNFFRERYIRHHADMKTKKAAPAVEKKAPAAAEKKAEPVKEASATPASEKKAEPAKEAPAADKK